LFLFLEIMEICAQKQPMFLYMETMPLLCSEELAAIGCPNIFIKLRKIEISKLFSKIDSSVSDALQVF